jgi:tRNA dimethylallyltransferase
MSVASEANSAILSVDSMQVYRGMDIGTAKPPLADRAAVRHFMIDVVDPADSYSVAEFRTDALSAIASHDVSWLVVGGSGLHFRSIVDPMDFAPTDAGLREIVEALSSAELIAELQEADPDAPLHVDMANRRRVVRAVEIARLTGQTPSIRAASARAIAVREYQSEIPVVVVGIDPGDQLPERIARRFDLMLEEGLLEEVTSLVESWGVTASQAVGYRELAHVVSGEWSIEMGRRRAIDASTALARRQRTYFRRDPRIQWLEWQDDPDRIAAEAASVFQEAGWSS